MKGGGYLETTSLF